MIRLVVVAAALALTARPPVGPTPRPQASLREAGEAARAAWQARNLGAFVSVSGGGPLLVTLPGARGTSPLSPRQARAILESYVQGTQEVATVLQQAVEVDSTEGYVRITRTYRLVGLPGEREAMMLLGFRRGRGEWVMTEVRISE